MAQQTAVEWILDRVEDVDNTPEIWDKIKAQAKQMEREQRINAQMDMFNHINGLDYGTDYLNRRDAALKYAEDYTTRLQNETN